MTKYPAGFYALGTFIPESPSEPHDYMRSAMVRQWSDSALVTLAPGEEKLFSRMLEHPTKITSVHCWGLARLLNVTIGMRTYFPKDGALFILVDGTFTPGYMFNVKIQALDFEPLAEHSSKNNSATEIW